MRIKSKKANFSLGLVILLMAFQSVPFERSTSSHEAKNVNSCTIENNAFSNGEEIVYKIYYNWNFVWLAAGEVTFKVEEKENQYHLSALGRTYKSYEWFYKIRDYYDTYVDKNTLLPNLSVRNINEGKYRLYDEIAFDQDKQKAVSLRGKTKESAQLTDYEIDPCMHDLLSVFYFSRNLNLESFDEGDIIPIKIFIDKEMWPLELKVRGRDTNKKIRGLGRFKTIKFGPEVIEGYYFKKGTEMNVWVSDDENKIPLLIESPVSVGSIKAVLKKHKGLRHELTSQIK